MSTNTELLQRTPYSVTNSLSFINWWERIEDLEKIDDDVLQQWSDQSRSWVTCACGNQCASIPRDDLGGPLDYVLRLLGESFPREIHSRNKTAAKTCLEEIEKRSAEILQEMSHA